MADRRRLAKIEKAIAQEIASALVVGVKDPRTAALISITGVKVSPDLSQARVEFSVLGEEGKVRTAQRFFNDSLGHFQTLIAQRLETRVTPKLSFHYDNTLAIQQKIGSLIDDALEEDRQAQAARDEEE